jgi:hypothetical protein
MNHLIRSEDLSRIEGILIQRRDDLVQATSWVFNLVLLGLVLAGFGYFLYTQYKTTQETQEQEKRIPFEPQVWYSATRNVRSEEYGSQLQPHEIETRYGVPGSAGRIGENSVFEDYNPLPR